MLLRLVTVAVVAPWVAACSSDVGSFNILPKLGTFDSLSVSTAPVNAELRPVTAADLVGPQGECAAGGAGAAAPRGGIVLEMTECEVVGRAGTPDNVQLGTNERGERMVTLTYTGGQRPGIYRFSAGRLYAIERGQEAPSEPAKPKKPPPKKPKSA
jgi:hypothetical protein